MRLHKSKTPDKRHRQRSVSDTEKPSSGYGFLYRARRSDDEVNVGRKDEKARERSQSVGIGNIWLQRFGLIILLVAIVVSVFNILSLSDTAQILTYTSGDTQDPLFNKGEYAAAVNHILSESVWNRNKVTINTSKISRELKSQFPEITNVSIALPLLSHNPLIYIQPARLVLVIQSSTSGAFVLDANGKALVRSSDNPVVAQKLNLPTVVDDSGLSITIGKQVLPINNVTFIQIVEGELAARHYIVESMTLPASSGELDVKIVGKPYAVKFNLESNDPQQQAGTFLATINQLEKQNTIPSKYVDVRVDGRAYYQ